MKKIFKNPILMFVLGAVIFSGITGVLASQLLAKDISYTPSDSSWNVSNVKDSLDYLYTSTNITITGLNSQISMLANEKNELESTLNYLNSGNCISGTFKCETCNTSSGNTIGKVNFNPTILFMYDNDYKYLLVYNKTLDPTKFAWYDSDARAYIEMLNFDDFLIFSNGTLKFRNAVAYLNNITYNYMACK